MPSIRVAAIVVILSNAAALPILVAKKKPATAEQLMRSRYSAFFYNNTAYLLATMHPDKQDPKSEEQLGNTVEQCEWITLKILECKKGTAEDEQGVVEFIASYREAGRQGFLYERSDFSKLGGEWFYVDGEIKDPSTISLNRNEMCWCGSGNKFKKCHG
jgi:SEC-C motif-containing protein